MSSNSPRDIAPPKPARWFVAWFREESRRRLRKAFHQVRLTRVSTANLEVLQDGPIVTFANHSSWWDPLIAMVLASRFFSERIGYTPIDAEMLEKYGIFRRLGFFGVDRSSRAATARQFLRLSQAVLEQPGTMLWLTPQGRFADVRERPVQFERGVAHLAKRVPTAQFVPLAIEYPFWEESRPEVLLHLGTPMSIDPELTVTELEQALAASLESTQDHLAVLSMRGAAEEFESVVEGSFGGGGIYEAWRRFRLMTSGRKSEEFKHGKL